MTKSNITHIQSGDDSEKDSDDNNENLDNNENENNSFYAEEPHDEDPDEFVEDLPKKSVKNPAKTKGVNTLN